MHMGQVAGSGFFVKVASGMVAGEVVDLISEGGKHDFRTFQKELVIIGTKKNANGPVAAKIRPIEVGDFSKKS